ncbi:ketose-bisphosphate aldolase [bacterium]|nr:ketose-bisphosphate aldolase [bacterium]
MLFSMKKLLDHAYENRYAVGAFNVVSIEFLEAIIETAESLASPVILNIAEPHFPYINIRNFSPTIRFMARSCQVPVALNLDHGMTLQGVVKAIRYGFTGVMYDGSKLSLEENISKTKSVVELCRGENISVEAELGAVGGDEEGGLESEADSRYFTDPVQAEMFIHKTGIDALAIAIGNTHGKYRGKPELDFNRLAAINKRAGIPLVLHGGSGIPEADFKKAIRMGIAKINFYTGMSQAALTAAKQFITHMHGKYHDFPELLRSIKQAVSQTVAGQIDIFGSGGQASKIR